VWNKLLDLYKKESNVTGIINAMDKMVCSIDRWCFGEVLHPQSPFYLGMISAIKISGPVKTKNVILAMKLPKRNEALLLKVFDWTEKFMN
jgi:hypothetical protein